MGKRDFPEKDITSSYHGVFAKDKSEDNVSFPPSTKQVSITDRYEQLLVRHNMFTGEHTGRELLEILEPYIETTNNNMNINIKSVDKLEEKYRVIHPEYGTLAAVMGSEQLKAMLILITGEKEQAFSIDGADITPDYEGYFDYKVYLVKEEHFDTINKLVGHEYFDEEGEMVSIDVYKKAKIDMMMMNRWTIINGCKFYFIKPKPEPFKWIKNESPLKTKEAHEYVLIYSKLFINNVSSMIAGAVDRDARPWADMKHECRFTVDEPAPSPYDQE